MILTPSRKLWTPADGWDWLNKFTSGKWQRASSGKLKRNSSTGKMRTNSASVTTCCCSSTKYQITRCCDGEPFDEYIVDPTTPYFRYNSNCWTVGTVTDGTGMTEVPAGDVEYFDSCTECIGGDCCDGCAAGVAAINVSFSGVSICTGCFAVGGVYGDRTGSLGTYTLTNYGSVYNDGCIYEYHETSPAGWSETIYDDNCTTPSSPQPTRESSLDIIFEQYPGYGLVASYTSGPGAPSYSLKLFDGGDATNCDFDRTFSNAQTGSCFDNISGNLYKGGFSGSATVSVA